MSNTINIDFKKIKHTIETKNAVPSIELNKTIVQINNIAIRKAIEIKKETVSIEKARFEVKIVYIPYFSDFAILQNDYLPNMGEYFLN